MRWIILVLFVLGACQKNPKDPCTYFRGTSMGKPYTVALSDGLTKKETKRIENLLKTIFSEVEESFDFLNPSSELAKFNREPGGIFVPVSLRMGQVLRLCEKIHSLSGGRFDPTVAPLSQVWGKALQEKQVPSVKEIEACCTLLGWSHIRLQNGSAKKDLDQIALDLTPVAQGQGIDRIMEELHHMGMSDIFINWGSQFKASGRLSEEKEWIVQIHPALQIQGQSLPPIPLKNASLAVAGSSQGKGWLLPASSALDGQAHRYCNIIDPLTAAPIEQTPYSIASVVVIAPNAALASALAKAAMVFPSRKEAESFAQEVVELFPDVSFWILSHAQRPST